MKATARRSATGGSAPAPRLRARLARLRRLWRDLTGESAYERYLERHRREHPGHPPMGEREYWRARADHDGTRLSTGCC